MQCAFSREGGYYLHCLRLAGGGGDGGGGEIVDFQLNKTAKYRTSADLNRRLQAGDTDPSDVAFLFHSPADWLSPA